MFTKRIIPCLDVNNGRVVKGVNFVNLRDAGDPVEIAAAYDKAGADEVVFIISAPIPTISPTTTPILTTLQHMWVLTLLTLQNRG